MQVTDQKRLEERKRPRGEPVVMYQKWRDLLFLHWEYPPETVQALLPPPLTVDTHEGKAYIGLVPFGMRGVRPRFVPPVRPVSNFLELNLRTYAIDERGRPGVWFFSLDAAQRLAVRAARIFFKLPYFNADMRCGQTATVGGRRFDYSCRRRGVPENATQRAIWETGSPIPESNAGSLSFFLIERYRLFAYNERSGRLYTGRVHHRPYELKEAGVEHLNTTTFTLDQIREPDGRPCHVVYSDGVDVEVFPLKIC